MYWRKFTRKDLNLRPYDPLKAMGKKSFGASKVKFVREQRIFAKGGKGPIKKRTTTVLRDLRLYMTTGIIQNTPPLSTLLNLFGINVIKFCEEYNARIKNLFLDVNIPVIISLRILKDLNFFFNVDSLRLNHFFVGLEINRFFGFKNTLYCNYKKINIEEASEIVDNIIIRNYTAQDFWFLMFIILKLSNIFRIYYSVNYETFLLTMRGFLKTFDVNKFKDFKYSSKY